MSAFEPCLLCPPKADVARRHWRVRLVPTTDIGQLFDHLIGAGDEHRRKIEAERLRSLEVDHQLVPCEAQLTARQQFVAHPLRIHSRPPLAAVRECAHSLITHEPCYLRDRKAGVTEIVRGEVGAELIENFTKTQAFRSQPPRQRPAAQAKHPRNSRKLRLAMRQEWSDRIFDSDT